MRGSLAVPDFKRPWIPTNMLKQQMSALPMAATITLQISRASSPQSALFIPDGPMTPLLGNPVLSIPTLFQSASALQSDKPPVIHFLLSPTSLTPFEELVSDSARSALSILTAPPFLSET